MSAGAHALPGVSIAYDVFIPILYRAVSRGFVSPLHAHYVHQGLRWGFDLGFSPDKLPGHHYFKNYISAVEAKVEVSKNIHTRLINHKSYSLFPFDPHTFRSQLSSFLPAWCVFPLGAVPKASEPGAFRPISDHSRTGFNDASCDDHLRHSLRSASEIARCLEKNFHMAVHDVDAAFPLLPLSPLLWPFFLFVWSPLPNSDDSDGSDTGEWIHWHVCGDFGAKGLPGTFKIFFSDVVIGMARSEGALTLDMPIHVDDMAIIGRLKTMVDDEASSLADFLQFLGTPIKESKRKGGAQRQFCIGFWWDSVMRTRTLEESKVLEYIAFFSACVLKPSLSLKEIQQAAGRLQRAVLTLPPGASCLLSNLFSLSRGLLRPQARVRNNKSCREDLSWASHLLEMNDGKGYFSYDQFSRAPLVATDASKSSRYVGGGYLSFCGHYSWWRYGASASRKPIDALEGDTVVKAACDLGYLWKKKVVPFAIDNQAFQLSAVKGYSKADRLSSLVRHLFSLAISFECIFEFNWISTHDNLFADALSRPDPLKSFLDLCSSHSSLLPPGLKLKQVTGSGATKALETPPLRVSPSSQAPGTVTCTTSGPEFSSDVAGDGAPSGRGGIPVAFSVTYPRASIYQGLPDEGVKASVSAIVADRLSGSSHSSMSAARGHWLIVAARHVWPRIIIADDPLRGGKLATFVSYLVYETEIKATSISNYVWALRSWFKLNYQPDPIYGVLEWEDFMQSVQVVAWCAREPRKAVPLRIIKGALESVDMSSFEEVQTALLIVMMFFSFSRSESPCPKSFTGGGSFDDTKHLRVCDVELRVHKGSVYLAIRLKSLKQDPRMERAEAAGNADWVYLGVADGVFNILFWLKAFWGFFPDDGSSTDRLPDSPFFRDFEGQRVLTYNNALESSRRLYAKVVSIEEASTYGLHGLRVEAYNRARAHDPLLAVAHGGWASVAHERYARFEVDDVLALPSAMLAGESQTSITSGGEAPPLIEPPFPEVSLSRQSGPRLGRARPRANSLSSPSGHLVLASSSSAPAPIPRSRVRAGANSSASAAHLSTPGVGSTPPPFQATPSPRRRAHNGAGSSPARSPRSRAGARLLASSSTAPAPIPLSRVRAGDNSSASAAHLSTPGVDLTPPPFQATPPPSRRALNGAGSAPPRSRAKARPRANTQLSVVATPVFSTPEARGSFPLPPAPPKRAGRRPRKPPHPSALPSPPPFLIGGSVMAPALPPPPAHLLPDVRNTSSSLPSMGSLRARSATFNGRYGA